jgi:hypothetical protein
MKKISKTLDMRKRLRYLVVSLSGKPKKKEVEMRKGRLTREQAAKEVGEELIVKLDAENCEPTGRVGYNGACQGDAETEWSASVVAQDADGDRIVVTAYYYTDNEDDQRMADCDGSVIDWKIEGYEIV